MQQRLRLKKYFSVFCIFFFINEIAVHRTNTVAPVAVAVPLAYDIALAGAAAIGAIYSAYLVSRLSDDLLRIHSQSLPAVAQELRTVYPVTPEVHVCTPGDIEHELENVIGTAAFKVPYAATNKRSPAFEQEIKDKIRTEIISPVVARTAYISSSLTAHSASSHISVAVPPSSIVVSYQPGAVRVDLKHINTYASIGLSNGETLSPLKQQLIQQDQARAVDAAVAAYVYEHSPAYRNDLLARFEAVGDVLYDTNRINPVVRIYARLALPHLQLEEPLNYMLQKVVDELIPLYFDTNGKLVHVERDFGYDRQFSIAKFLRNGTSDYYYRRQIDVFNLHHVKEHENSIGVAIKNNFRHIFTGRWLPNMYPADIRNKISSNGHNETIKRLLYYCNRYNFIEADNFIKQCTDPIYQKVYTECYNHYIAEYCDDYGIRYRYSKDPYWTRLSHKVKQELAKDIHAITEQNAALATRSIQKKAMQNAWQISDDVPDHVHYALYDLIEDLGTGPQFVAKVHEIVARYTGNEREELVRALFLPNGFLKDFGHFDESKFYDFPQIILDVEHAQDLKRINELLYSAHAYSGTEQSYHAFDELGKIYSCYKLPSAVVELADIRDHIESEVDAIFEELSERVAKIAVAIKQYNQSVAANDVRCFTAQKPEDQQPTFLMQNSGGGGGGAPNGPGGPGGPDNQPPDPDDDEEIDLPEYPKDPKGWPDQKWKPCYKKIWSIKRSYVYLKFIGDCCLSIGLSALGLPYSEFMLAFNLYKNIPGFLCKTGPFRNVVRYCLTEPVSAWHNVKGYVFEIKTALWLEAQNIKVLMFGKKIGGKQIDIVTEKLWIECKDWAWNNLNENRLGKFLRTTGKVKKLADAEGVDYAIVSHGPMPEAVKTWLKQKKILFFEI